MTIEEPDPRKPPRMTASTEPWLAPQHFPNHEAAEVCAALSWTVRASALGAKQPRRRRGRLRRKAVSTRASVETPITAVAESEKRFQSGDRRESGKHPAPSFRCRASALRLAVQHLR